MVYLMNNKQLIQNKTSTKNYEEDYTHTIRYTAGGSSPYTGPFEGGTLCWSGEIDWSQATFNLTGYSGSVQLRFRFGSDNASEREGWFVDDIQIDMVGALEAPVNLEANLTGSEVTLTWNSPGVNPGLQLLNYNIYRDGTKIDSLVQTTTYMDDLAAQGFGTYSYQVSAQYGAGESAQAGPVSVNYTGAGLAIVMSSDIRLDWIPVAGATGYRIYFGDNPTEDPTGSDDWNLIGTTSNVYYIDEDVLLTKFTGFYVVTAIDE